MDVRGLIFNDLFVKLMLHKFLAELSVKLRLQWQINFGDFLDACCNCTIAALALPSDNLLDIGRVSCGSPQVLLIEY